MVKKLREIAPQKKPNMSAWVAKHLDGTDLDHDQVKKKFIKTFGKEAHDKHFEKLVTKHIG